MIRVNNRDEVAWEEGLTVARLLERFNYIHPHLVIRVNGVVVPDEEFESRLVPEDSEVWVIHLIAGG